MGQTVIEKIIEHNTGKEVKPGDIVTVNVDRVMIHDIFIPFVAEKFREMGFEKLWDPDKVVLIYDHLVPASQLDDTRHFHTGDAFAEKYGMTRDELYFKMKQQGVLGRRYFYPLISEFSTYRGLDSAIPENLPVARRIANSVICIPMYSDLNDDNIQRVLDCI